ncbi:uncharacterized protein LOC131156526 isoform X2 [Malania oleifera]|nr:uncharacterized protein LOC131156526 isoform X2 [Malania oleifera]
MSRAKDQFSVDQDHNGLECNFKSEVKSKCTLDGHEDNRMSLANFESDEGKCLPQLPGCNKESARISNIESEEPGELSQATALNLVDEFLSVNNVNLSVKVEPRKTTGDKSPPVSSVKGAQSLAQKINLRNTIGERGIFEWVDGHDDQRGSNLTGKRVDSFFDSGGHGHGSGTWPNKPREFYDKGGSHIGNECNKKMEILNVLGELTGSTDSDSTLLLHNLNDADLEKQLTAELCRQQLEASGTERDALDMFDIGLGTQIAAEAMEALSNALPAHCNDDSDKGENTFEDLPKGVTQKGYLEHYPFQKTVCSDSNLERKLKQTKRLTENSSRETSALVPKQSKNQEFAAKIKTKMGKSMDGVHGMYPAYANARSSRRSSKPTKQRKTEEVVNRDNIKEVDTFISPSTLIEGISLGKAWSQKECRNFSPIAARTRHQASGTKKMGNDPGANDIMEVNDHKKKCMKRGLNADEFEVSRIGQKIANSRLNISGKARKRKRGPEEHTGVEAAALKLDVWSYPRRKRTHRTAPNHSDGSGNLNAFSMVDEEEGIGYHIKNLKKLKDSSKTISFNLDTKRKIQLSESNSEGCLLRQKLDGPGSAVDVFCHNAAAANKRIFNMKMVGVEASTQFRKLDEMDSVLPGDHRKKDIKFQVSAGKKIEHSVSECTSTVNSDKVIDVALSKYMVSDNHRSPCNKNLPKSSLIKELISLGIPELAPSFTSKNLRRRRNMANVRVLFSQNLDEDIIKQQKKILARLGIPIASSAFDATHFVADKFVRTRNMLEIIALGKPVVTHLWLESCAQASCFIDEKNYILRDAKKEKEIGFSLPVSLARASQHPLLKGQIVLITPNAKPSKDMIASLVMAVHGKAVERIQTSIIVDENISDDKLIISCEEDYAICVPFLEKGAAVYSSELLLNGIVIQKLEWERHRLFARNTRRN